MNNEGTTNGSPVSLTPSLSLEEEVTKKRKTQGTKKLNGFTSSPSSPTSSFPSPSSCSSSGPAKKRKMDGLVGTRGDEEVMEEGKLEDVKEKGEDEEESASIQLQGLLGLKKTRKKNSTSSSSPPSPITALLRVGKKSLSSPGKGKKSNLLPPVKNNSQEEQNGRRREPENGKAEDEEEEDEFEDGEDEQEGEEDEVAEDEDEDDYEDKLKSKKSNGFGSSHAGATTPAPKQRKNSGNSGFTYFQRLFQLCTCNFLRTCTCIFLQILHLHSYLASYLFVFQLL